MIVQQLDHGGCNDLSKCILHNMRPMIMEQLFTADVVIFNRCDDEYSQKESTVSTMSRQSTGKRSSSMSGRTAPLDENDTEELTV